MKILHENRRAVYSSSLTAYFEVSEKKDAITCCDRHEN